MLTLLVVLGLAALGCTIAALMNKCPLAVAVLILCVIVLIQALPLGK